LIGECKKIYLDFQQLNEGINERRHKVLVDWRLLITIKGVKI
jgi:hypothetical protein